MNPDDTMIALWLDDELAGSELKAMEAWAKEQPEQLAERENIRNFRAKMGANLPNEVELPFADFFSSRVRQGIEEQEKEVLTEEAREETKWSFWRSWMMPVAACLGMIVAFSVGMQTGGGEAIAEVNSEQVPIVYTPTAGVDAKWVAGTAGGGNANVILLSGVDAIPDSMDFSETVYIPTASEADRTALRAAGRSAIYAN